MLVNSFLGGFFLLNRPEEFVNVGDDATTCNLGLRQQLVEFLVIADSELEVSGCDGLLLVLVGALSRQIEDLHHEVLKGCGHEDTTSRADLCRVAAYLELSLKACNWEDETGLDGAYCALSSLSLGASFAFSCHFLVEVGVG